MKLNEILKELRMTSSITQAELAKKIGVSRQQLVNWELGLAYPSDKHFIHIAVLELFKNLEKKK